MMTGKQYGTIGLVGVGYFVVAVGALHFLDSERTSADVQISDYLNGDYGWLMLTAFVGAGIGTLAIAIGLRAALASSRSATASWILMFIAGIGFVRSCWGVQRR